MIIRKILNLVLKTLFLSFLGVFLWVFLQIATIDPRQYATESRCAPDYLVKASDDTITGGPYLIVRNVDDLPERARDHLQRAKKYRLPNPCR